MVEDLFLIKGLAYLVECSTRLPVRRGRIDLWLVALKPKRGYLLDDLLEDRLFFSEYRQGFLKKAIPHVLTFEQNVCPAQVVDVLDHEL